ATNSGNRASRSHAEVIVAVKVKGHAVSHPLANLPHEKLHGFRAARTDCVHHHNFRGACLERFEIHLFQEFELRPRTVHGEESHANAVLTGEGNGVAHAVHDLVPSDAVSTQLDVARGSFNDRSAESEAHQLFDIRANGPRKTPQLGPEVGPEHQL